MALHNHLFNSLNRLFAANTIELNADESAARVDARFAAELAALAPEDREKRIAQRRRYEAFARRRGLVDAEMDADLHRYKH